MPKDKNSELNQFFAESVTLDTSNILFIASGAFTNLDKIISKRQNTKVKLMFFLNLKRKKIDSRICSN